MNGNKLIAVNSVIIFIRLVVTTLIGLIASRLVLDALGASDYGLYNVVGGIVTMLNVVNTAMTSATYRFVAFELGKKDGNVNKVYNVSLAIHACFALFIIIICLTLGVWYLNNYLNVEVGKEADAHFVFYISVVTTAISTLLIPCQGLITAYEKFNVLAIRDIIFRILYLLAVWLLLKHDGGQLRLYAIITLVYNVLYNGSFFTYCRYKFSQETKLRVILEKDTYKEMLGFSGWILFGTVSSVGKSTGSNIIINYFFGTVVNAAYAVAHTIDGFINTFARSLNNAAIPQITKSFSGGNEQRSITLTSYISKYTFILMLFVAYPVMLEMDFLLGLWLKEVPDGAPIFSKLLVLAALIGTLGEGIPALVAATGKIRAFQVIFYTFNLLGLPVAFIAYRMGANQYAIVIVYCFIAFFSTFLRLFILKVFYKFDVMQIVKISYSRIAYISLPLLAFYFLYNPDYFTTFWGHIGGLCLSEFVLVMVILVLGLDLKERKLFKQFIGTKLLKQKS